MFHRRWTLIALLMAALATSALATPPTPPWDGAGKGIAGGDDKALAEGRQYFVGAIDRQLKAIRESQPDKDLKAVRRRHQLTSYSVELIHVWAQYETARIQAKTNPDAAFEADFWTPARQRILAANGELTELLIDAKPFADQLNNDPRDRTMSDEGLKRRRTEEAAAATVLVQLAVLIDRKDLAADLLKAHGGTIGAITKADDIRPPEGNPKRSSTSQPAQPAAVTLTEKALIRSMVVNWIDLANRRDPKFFDQYPDPAEARRRMAKDLQDTPKMTLTAHSEFEYQRDVDGVITCNISKLVGDKANDNGFELQLRFKPAGSKLVLLTPE